MSPDTYTHGHHDSVLRSHRWRTVDNSAAYLRAYLVPGIRVLDVGCGPGTITADLARLVAPGEVVGLDRAESVIVQARDEIARRAATAPQAAADAQVGTTPGDAAAPQDAAGAARAIGTHRVSFRTGDIYALDFPDGEFEVTHAHQVLQHLSDPVAALRQMRRVARPGGVVAARDSDYAAMAWHPRDPLLTRWLSIYRELAHGNNAEPDAGRCLLAWAHEAGFTQVTPSASVWCFATPAERAWWAGMWADRVVQSDYARQALDRGLADRDDLAAIAGAWRAWAEHPDGWFIVPHGEILAIA